MDLLIVDARWQQAFLHLGRRTASEVMALFGGESIVRSPDVIVRPCSLVLSDGESVPVFLKQYCYPGPSGRFWLRASKARREFESYAVFEQLGVRCAQRIACGESRDWLGRLRHAFILTRAVPNAGTLLEYLGRPGSTGGEACPPEIRQVLRRQLAAMTRRIHEAGFFHNDLYWRNVLVEVAPAQPPQLCWIDCPRGSFARWSTSRQRRRIKDLAALDRSAVELCSRAERLRFMKDYLGQPKLDASQKKLIREIVNYRLRRWRSSAEER
jgi:hypothetical protein